MNDSATTRSQQSPVLSRSGARLFVRGGQRNGAIGSTGGLEAAKLTIRHLRHRREILKRKAELHATVETVCLNATEETHDFYGKHVLATRQVKGHGKREGGEISGKSRETSLRKYEK